MCASRLLTRVKRGNIIDACVDAVCVSANRGLQGPRNKAHWRFVGQKNVELAVHAKCGGYIDPLTGVNQKIVQACQRRHPQGLSVGQAAITSSFREGDGFKFVIHACTPWVSEVSESSDRLLIDAYANVLKIAQTTKNIKSVAIPALGSGVNLVSPEVTAACAFKALAMFRDAESSANGLQVEFHLMDQTAHGAFVDVFGEE